LGLYDPVTSESQEYFEIEDPEPQKAIIPRKNSTSVSKPAIPKSLVFTVPSFTESGVNYSVSLHDWTCTCPDWEKRRRNFKKGDIRRLCKHLVRSWGEVGFSGLGHFSGIVAKYNKLGWGIHVNKTPDVVDCDGNILAMLIPDAQDEGQWYDISFHGDYFAYSKDYGKWAHGNEPPAIAVRHFYSILYGTPKRTGTIVTLRRERSFESIPGKLMNSQGITENLVYNGGWVAIGAVEGVEVLCCINPKAGWQCFIYDGIPAAYNVRDKAWNGPAALAVFELDAIAWINQEFAQCVKAKS
jgi:hypothetical protein